MPGLAPYVRMLSDAGLRGAGPYRRLLQGAGPEAGRDGRLCHDRWRAHARPLCSFTAPRTNSLDTGGRALSEPQTTSIDINGHACRVWTKGSGPKLGWIAGFGGMPRWIPFLDKLAEKRTVIVPSLPGFPGATGHTLLDTHLDWVIAVRQIIQKSGLEGADLAGSSVGASFIAEMAALWPTSVKRIVMIAPFGLYDDKNPPTDVWAQRPDDVAGIFCANPEIWKEFKAVPPGANSVEWPIEQVRASEAAARIFWPLGNSRLERRLPMVGAETLLLWGEQDRVIPRSYADWIAKAIKGRSQIRTIPGAGHLAELDQPEATAAAIESFLA
jgi:abhydrolase domain-containing protein 6